MSGYNYTVTKKGPLVPLYCNPTKFVEIRIRPNRGEYKFVKGNIVKMLIGKVKLDNVEIVEEEDIFECLTDVVANNNDKVEAIMRVYAQDPALTPPPPPVVKKSKKGKGKGKGKDKKGKKKK